MRICKYYDAVGIVTGIVFSCDLSFFPLPMNIPNDNHAVVADDELCVCDESECESFSEYDSECESECESESEWRDHCVLCIVGEKCLQFFVDAIFFFLRPPYVNNMRHVNNMRICK